MVVNKSWLKRRLTIKRSKLVTSKNLWSLMNMITNWSSPRLISTSHTIKRINNNMLRTRITKAGLITICKVKDLRIKGTMSWSFFHSQMTIVSQASSSKRGSRKKTTQIKSQFVQFSKTTITLSEGKLTKISKTGLVTFQSPLKVVFSANHEIL